MKQQLLLKQTEVLLILRVLLMPLTLQNVVDVAADELNCSEILVVRVEVDSFFSFFEDLLLTRK